MANEKIYPLVVAVKKLDKNTLHLKQHLGNGSFGDVKFDASLTLPDMSLIVDVDGSEYILSSQETIQSIIQLHIEIKGEQKR